MGCKTRFVTTLCLLGLRTKMKRVFLLSSDVDDSSHVSAGESRVAVQ